MITMIDYGASNIRSAQKAFEHLGAHIQLSQDPEAIARASKLVLPGVGAFGAGMRGLQAHDLPAAIQEAVSRGIPFLGICVGMQLMFDESEEMGAHQGLGLIPGKVKRFKFGGPGGPKGTLKIPHMGWNQLEPAWENPLLAGIQPGEFAYFVHSYYCDPVAASAVLAWTDYGFPFASIVAKQNVFGLQFHPEKSQHTGLRILQNFIEKI